MLPFYRLVPVLIATLFSLLKRRDMTNGERCVTAAALNIQSKKICLAKATALQKHINLEFVFYGIYLYSNCKRK